MSREPKTEAPPKPARRAKKRPEKQVIGWREWLAIPELQVTKIKAKVDTGARSSSLHAFDMQSFTRDGDDWIRFSIHPLQDDSKLTHRVEAPMIDRRKVRPSTGEAKIRPVIEARVALGDCVWPIEITLVRRDMMGFRMLLGRQALRGRYVVDAGRSFVAGEPAISAIGPGFGPSVTPSSVSTTDPPEEPPS